MTTGKILNDTFKVIFIIYHIFILYICIYDIIYLLDSARKVLLYAVSVSELENR